ncbi:MAG: C40 family peptidase [Cytophagales bacterium]|nr:C40 family peptidase [Rhizobacter sp.]
MNRLAPASLRTALAALAFATAASLAHAAPDGNDLVAKLLVDKGVLDARVFDSPAGAVESASSLGQQVRNATSGLVVSAMNFLGVPYKRGGNNADNGFDCSGFTRHIYENSLGLLLPRKADEQAKASGLAPVKRNELKPGDLVFFNTMRRTFSHVGIYVGEDKFIHAPKPGGEVRVESMGVRYWAKRFTGGRRAAQATAATPAVAVAAPVIAEASAIPNDNLSP